jgi:phytoene dehydrogenase-like protein
VSLGGKIQTGAPIRSAKEIPDARSVFFDLTPGPLLKITGERFPPRFQRALRKFRGGPGVFKLDWALSAPVPWKSPECAKASTVHLGGTLEELIVSEQAPWDGIACEKPFVLLSQPTTLDPSRAPAGKHTLWAYCHVPRGSTADMTAPIEAQIERVAPGFRDLILAKHVSTPKWMEEHNENLVGGDISGGIADFRQLFFRPTIRRVPYTTPVPNWYLCSASTPPGAGVHGMCGFEAARAAMKRGV